MATITYIFHDSSELDKWYNDSLEGIAKGVGSIVDKQDIYDSTEMPICYDNKILSFMININNIRDVVNRCLDEQHSHPHDSGLKAIAYKYINEHGSVKNSFENGKQIEDWYEQTTEGLSKGIATILHKKGGAFSEVMNDAYVSSVESIAELRNEFFVCTTGKPPDKEPKSIESVTFRYITL